MQTFSEQFEVRIREILEPGYYPGKLTTIEEIKSFFSSQVQACLEEIEKSKKRMDVGDYGVDSVSYPNGEIWTNEKRDTFNQALSEAQAIIKKHLI